MTSDDLLHQVKDQFGNPAPDDGYLTAEIVGPDRVSKVLDVTRTADGLLAKYEALLMGMYWLDVLLNGTPVQGSPMTFK